MALLVTLSDMKSRLGITGTTYDDFLTEQITMVSEAIENYCGRVFTSTTYTQTYYGDDYRNDNDAEKLITFHYPVTAVTSIKEIRKDSDGNDSETTTLTTDEFRHHPDSGIFKKTYSSGQPRFWFTEYGYVSRVEIVYTAGYVTIPFTIQEVVYALVTERYNKHVNNLNINFGNDVQRISIPGVMSVDFDYTLQANERKNAFGMILGNYANVLDMYRSERVISGAGEIKENYVV